MVTTEGATQTPPRVRGRWAALASDHAMTLWFIAFAFALAFWQRPGWAASDTKIDLYVDPGRFLSQVASAWSPTSSLGEVHSSQYSGYLWPMGPFFAVAHAIGISAWVAQRMWLGLMFAIAAWGMLKLLDALIGRPRGTAHVVAAAFYVLNPYVVLFSTRASVILLGYAVLPWMMVATYHGVRASRGWRAWRGWWWAGAFALILTSAGGGVNAAVVGWVLVGPLVLALYEPAIGAVRWRDSLGFLVRVGILGLLASLWWIVPVLVHVRYGIDFLPYTEQPSTIWATNSATEALRLMGFWESYIGTGYGVTRSLFADSGTMLFNPLVVGASLLVPALAVTGYVRARRTTYAPLLLALVVVGAVIMVAGFPDGTPLREVMDWVYRKSFVLRFMRTTYKEGPVVALGLAGLLGIAAQQILRRLRALSGPTPPLGRPRRRSCAAGRCDRAGRIAARTRRRDRYADRVEADSVGVEEHREVPRPKPPGEHTRARAARADLRVLHLGWHDRLDPAAAHEPPGRRPLRDAVRGPAFGRPPHDRRRHGSATPARAGSAATAAEADRRRGGRHRRRRRHDPERRDRSRRGGERAERAARPDAVTRLWPRGGCSRPR